MAKFANSLVLDQGPNYIKTNCTKKTYTNISS